jgi:hypothetical protein
MNPTSCLFGSQFA